MASLVLELQQDALDPTVPVSNLLRKVIAVARKLELGDLEKWARSDLDGYGTAPAQDIPPTATSTARYERSTHTTDGSRSGSKTGDRRDGVDDALRPIDRGTRRGHRPRAP